MYTHVSMKGGTLELVLCFFFSRFKDDLENC